MKPHLCSLNWSKWSGAVDGYSERIQVRACTICEKLNWRNIGYAEQVKADAFNKAAKEAMENTK